VSVCPPDLDNRIAALRMPPLATATPAPTNPENPVATQVRSNYEWPELWNTGAGFLPDAQPWSIEETLGPYDFDLTTQWGAFQNPV
jgi:hypothetical protein